MSAPNHDFIVIRAAEHMIRQHGRHAADFAEFRSRELRALGNAEAADLWAAVAGRIGECQDGAQATLSDRCFA